jgi:hypothetical protein
MIRAQTWLPSKLSSCRLLPIIVESVEITLRTENNRRAASRLVSPDRVALNQLQYKENAAIQDMRAVE